MKAYLKTMNRFIPMILIAFFVTSCVDEDEPNQLASEDSADLILVGISPSYTEAQGTQVLLSLSELLKRTKLGSTTIVVDALNCKQVAEFSVPADKAAFVNEKARNQIFSDDLQKLKQFVLKGAGHENASASLHVPRFLEMATEIASSRGGKTSVLMIGSALHQDPEGNWTFGDLRIPGDGTLKTSVLKNPFGTEGKEKFLSNMELHFVHLNKWESEAYRLGVRRFWHLFCKLQQEEPVGLITFTSDFDQGVGRLLTPDLKPLWTFEIDEKATALEMVPILPPVSDVPDTPLPVLENSKPTEIKQEARQSSSGLSRVGLRWEANIDLDLYVRTPSGEELFFDRRTGTDGFLYKDDRQAPEDSRGFEHIVFTTPVDPGDLVIWVNHYRGDVGEAPSAELVFEIQGKWYSKELVLGSTSGNRGVNRHSKRAAPHWVGPIKISEP